MVAVSGQMNERNSIVVWVQQADRGARTVLSRKIQVYDCDAKYPKNSLKSKENHDERAASNAGCF